MKLIIIDDYKLTKFSLPKEVQDYFLVPYKFKGESQIKYLNIENSDGKWVLKSNNEINVLNNGIVMGSIKLEDYAFYRMEVLPSKTPIFLFCAPSEEEFSEPLDVQTRSEIKIGKSPNCDIVYNDISTIDVHAVITNQNGMHVISVTNEKAPVYVNEFRVTSAVLKLGDIIFINGLKIIWMNTFIKINKLGGRVQYGKLTKYVNTLLATMTYNPIKMDLSDIELYKDSEYFYHTPRLKYDIENESVRIDAPPRTENLETMPVVLTLGSSLTMGASSFVMGYSLITGLQNGTKTLAGSFGQIIMCVAMVIGALIMPRLTQAWQHNQKKKREKLRQKKYTAYLNEKQQKITSIMQNQIQTLNDNYMDPEKCASAVLTKSRRLWERRLKDTDFLSISFGQGSMDAKLTIEAPEEKFTLDEDNLEDKVFEMVNQSKVLQNVPVVVDIVKERNVAVTGRTLEKSGYIDYLILQLITYHSPAELKIVFITDDEGNKKYNYIKYLPHVWNADKTTRYYANGLEEAKEVFSDLENIYKKRVELLKSSQSLSADGANEIKQQEEYKNFDTYYLIVSNSFKTIRNIPFADVLLKSETNYGFSMMLIENTMKDLPSECETFAYISDQDSCLFTGGLSNASSQKQFVPAEVQGIDMDLITKTLANIPMEIKDAESILPTSLTFLEMMKVSKIEQLNVATRWVENDPTRSLQTPIGVHANGETFHLNLHEKFHGPHGLIAGSTGSGKSEFIITLVLSLAVNYSPEEVQFVLIDYKGGGLAGAFENREKGFKIPHLAGTITNLDTSEMNRTLVSIQSELKRRQKKFNEVRDRLGEGTIDIYKYQRLYRDGVIKEPISHLLIICDEFAELKSQRPEFMDELISTSRIGRSLGVHLILATQKPTGVVNDQIWANSKFKVCLKVQDRSDSMGMLKKPDAASIKETGRFYLQVGYDEYYDIGQSGWSGAKYIPSDALRKKMDDSINYLDDLGNVVKSVNDAIEEVKQENFGDQLTNTVKYLIESSKKMNIQTRPMWLDNIPKEIFIQGLTEKYSYKAERFHINPIVGEYDYPANQEQGLYTLDLSKNGNTLIYGMPGSGKENLLYTLIVGTAITHSPDEVNFYIMDFGAETMKMFAKYPHVGDVSLLDDQEKVMNTFILLDQEVDKRKELFSDYAGSYENYCKNSGSTLPLIITIINGYEVFTENYSKLSEIIQPLIRDGAKYGVIFIVTTSVANSVRSRMLQNFGNVLSLQQQNDQDYRNLLGAAKGLIPTKTFGRGIAKMDKGVLEFQTAFVGDRDKITDIIKNIREKLETIYPDKKARSVPVLPEDVLLDDIKDKVEAINKLPIGVEEDSKNLCLYDFTKNVVTSIVGNNMAEHIGFVNSIIKEMLMIKDVDVKVVDVSNLITEKIKNMAIAKDNFDVAMKELIKEINDSPKNKITSIYIFVGIGEMKSHLSEEGIQLYNAIFANVKKFLRTKIILIDNYTSYKKIQVEPWYSLAINASDGIWVGEGIGVQMAINYNSITDDARKASFDNIGFAINNGVPTLIKCVTDKGPVKK